MPLHQLVQLQAHQARHGGRGGGDGRDDPPCDALALRRHTEQDARTDALQAGVQQEGGSFSYDQLRHSLQQRISTNV